MPPPSVAPDLHAQWIAAPWRGSPRASAPAPYLRKAFSLPGPVASATLSISALGLYEAEINGDFVGDEIFAPGWTDYRTRVQYQTHEVGEWLRSGENVLGVVLGDGWYCGYTAWEERQSYGERPWLIASLTVRLVDGSIIRIDTDSTWKTHRGPILEADMLMGEIHDARLELVGWSSPGHDDTDWLPVQTSPAPEPSTQLVPRVGPPVRRIREIKPASVKFSPDGLNRQGVLVDFGQNFAGRARITVKARPGTTLRLRYGEVLDPAGALYIDNLRGARATDCYTCRSDEAETWEPRFTFHGFRYMDVIGLADTDTFSVTGVVLHSDMEETGSFACSNPLLNQLQSNIVWGQRSNFLEVPTDCPQRDERLGWTGDAQVFARTAAFNFDVSGFFDKWLQDMRDSQRPSGAIPFVIPMPREFRHLPFEDGGPAWSDACVICPWTIYIAYGDTRVLADHYESMRAYMDFVERDRCKGHIRSHAEVDTWGGFGDWLALDGSGKLEGNTPKDLIGTALHANNADIMVRAAVLLGRERDAAFYRELHAKIVAAFRRRFLTPDGLVAAATQTAHVLALHFGLVPESARENCHASLERLVRANGEHIATGFVGTPYLLDVLEAGGSLELAYRLLEQETFPSWLFPVKNGATTIWERWNGWTPDGGFQDKFMNSFNHYAYGAVGAWMYHTVAGINPDPAEPGYRHIIFQPRPGGSLTWAEAKLKTRFGDAAIRWERTHEGLRLRITVPEGVRGTLKPVPGHDRDREDISLAPGTHDILLTSNSAPTPESDDQPCPVGA